MSEPRPEPARESAVALPQLRLQLLLRRRPEWRDSPVAVVAEESPESPLLELSARALERGLRPGLRLGAARNADLELRTGVVSAADAASFADELATDLGTFSPRVEPCLGRGGPLAIVGAYFVDPRGLEGLYGDTTRWASSIESYLRGRGLSAVVVVGHQAQRCLAIARASPPKTVAVLEPEAERRAAAAVSLRRAGIAERICEPLARLGVATVGQLLELPAGELRTRFGPEIAELHRLLGDGAQLPLQPRSIALPPRATLAVEPPTADASRLAFHLKRAVDRVVAQAAGDHQVLMRMELELALERYGRGRTLATDERRLRCTLEPAAPSRDGRQWVELWRLRLAALRLPAPVEGLVLEGVPVCPEEEQLATAAVAPSRDARAAHEALARVAAAFGPESVVRLSARDAHLPEAALRLEPIEPGALRFQGSAGAASWHALRRMVRPERLPTDGEGWPVCEAPIADRSGPHRISGGWWGRAPDAATLTRDYWYFRLEDGQIWWVFHDRIRDGWFLQARVG